MNDDNWRKYTNNLKAILGRIPEDGHGRKQLHCAHCGHPVLVSLKWLFEEGNCLKWYGCYLAENDSCEKRVNACVECGTAFLYPPQLREMWDALPEGVSE